MTEEGDLYKAVDTPEERLEGLIYSQDIADVPDPVKKLLEATPHLIVKPRSIDQIVQVLKTAGEKGAPVVPRGSASSGFGGVIPLKGGIVIDLSSMNKILEVDREDGRVLVEAGVRWWDLERTLEKVGLALKTYPSSIFSTVGGWASTKGYGINSLRYGPLKEQILSIEVVTPRGEVKHLEATHPEFKYYIGTEGQMGIITKVALSVREKPRESHPILLQFPGTGEALTFTLKIFEKGVNPLHIIYMDRYYLGVANRLLGEALIKEMDSLLIYLEDKGEVETLQEVLEGENDVERAPDYLASYLWHERFFPMKVKRLGPGYLACELLLPIKRIEDYLEKVRGVAAHYGVEIFTEAHIVTREEAVVTASFLTDQRRLGYYLHLLLVMILTEVGVEMGGKPYGVGIWNTLFLRHIFPQGQVEEYRRYKERVDPHYILNPGKFFEIKTKYLRVPKGLLRTNIFDLVFKALTSLSPILGRLAGMNGGPSLEGERGKAFMRIAPYACAKCGSCIPVCPAYLVTGDERVTARGKLLALKELLEGRGISREEAELVFLCLHCKACDSVCQSELPLSEVWDALEEELERLYGRPEERISRFVEMVEESEEYKRFVDEHSLLISIASKGGEG